jgi:hypothetical protein
MTIVRCGGEDLLSRQNDLIMLALLECLEQPR